MSENFIDTDFTETNSNNDEINGKPLYYMTSQVATILNETDSTIRFWCSKFKDILKIEMTGSHRRFKEEDIKKLKYIKKLLREENFSIQQVQEYGCQKDKSIIKKKIQNQDPLAIQSLATSIAIEVGGQLEDFKLMIRDQLIEEMKNNQKEMKEYLAVSINEKLDEKLDGVLTEFKSYIDTKEHEANVRDRELIDLMKNRLDEHKNLQEQVEQEKNKHWWNKIF